MPKYPIHELTATEFEQLVTLICRNIMGVGITSFAPGPDGGKDARFEGTANAFPSEAAPASGKFIIQAKHTSKPQASCSDNDFENTIVGKEIKAIKRQYEAGQCTHYLLFTNRMKTGGAEVRIPARITGDTGVQNVWLRSTEDIERELSLHPEIVEAAGLNKFRAPIQFSPEDIRDVIVALHEHREAISSTFDSQHDFTSYPGLERKNEINGLSPAYNKYICDDSMKNFPAIRVFLENHRNQSFADQYHAVADDLKGQIIAHRDRFDKFDDVLEGIAVLVRERSPELQAAPKRLMIKKLVHYMYVNCDIGEKE